MKRYQTGATIVEFALSLLIFLMFLLGIIDFSRMLYTWNAANEATRYGARYATVCDDKAHEAVVLNRMQRVLPEIEDIEVAWQPAGCTITDCTGVTVAIENLDYQWISPVAGIAQIAPIPMPSFSTYLPREIMRQDKQNSEAFCS